MYEKKNRDRKKVYEPAWMVQYLNKSRGAHDLFLRQGKWCADGSSIISSIVISYHVHKDNA